MSPEGRTPRVLVVDDDPLMVELLTTRLGLAGYQTCSARDGRDVLERLADLKPDAMVLDINMPRLDGFGVLRALKARGALDRLPTMVLTARNRSEDVAKAIGLGARDFLAKPFQDDVLLARVARLLARSRGPAPSAS